MSALRSSPAPEPRKAKGMVMTSYDQNYEGRVAIVARNRNPLPAHGSMTDSITLPLPTSAGTFTATFTPRGLAALRFPSKRQSPTEAPPLDPRAKRLARLARLTLAALESVLAGRAPRELPPFDWSGATPFRQRVWTALRGIVPGHTLTYSQVAAAIGSPKAARAVGSACGANPIPVLVPCHRVLAAGGGLGGFSGGLDWKKKLLAAETHQPKPKPA